MHLSPIQRYRPGRIAAANPAAGQHTRAGLSRRPGISTYQYIPVHTVLYLLVLSLYHCEPLCTWLYLLVPPCTVQYIPVHTCMYCHRNVIGHSTDLSVLVCTKLPFLVQPCIQKRVCWYVPVRTTLYCLVPGVQDSRCWPATTATVTVALQGPTLAAAAGPRGTLLRTAGVHLEPWVM